VAVALTDTEDLHVWGWWWKS